MGEIRHWLALGLIVAAMPFFLAGTVGLLRFPDTLTRIHAVTKADNVGLGLLTAGLILRNWSPAISAELLLIWVLVLSAGATGAHLVGVVARRDQGDRDSSGSARQQPPTPTGSEEKS